MRRGFAHHFRHLDDLFAPKNLTLSTILFRSCWVPFRSPPFSACRRSFCPQNWPNLSFYSDLVGSHFELRAVHPYWFWPGVPPPRLSMVITSTVYWKFRQSLVSQATLQPLILCADSFLICFIAVEIVKTNLNTPIWKAWGRASRAQRPLPTGIVRRQFPSLRGTTWRNKGRSAWNGSRLEHICAFYVEITNIQGVKLKMSCYNRD